MGVDRRSMMLAGAFGLTAGAASADVLAGSAKSLVGAWTLADADTIYTDGRVTPFMGLAKPYQGLLIYTPQGMLSFQVSSVRKPRSPNDPPLTPQEKAANYDLYKSYFGHYEVDEAASVVTLRIITSIQPEQIGAVLRRHYELAGDTLTLKTEVGSAGIPNSYNRLVWHRQA